MAKRRSGRCPGGCRRCRGLGAPATCTRAPPRTSGPSSSISGAFGGREMGTIEGNGEPDAGHRPAVGGEPSNAQGISLEPRRASSSLGRVNSARSPRESRPREIGAKRSRMALRLVNCRAMSVDAAEIFLDRLPSASGPWRQECFLSAALSWLKRGTILMKATSRRRPRCRRRKEKDFLPREPRGCSGSGFVVSPRSHASTRFCDMAQDWRVSIKDIKNKRRIDIGRHASLRECCCTRDENR